MKLINTLFTIIALGIFTSCSTDNLNEEDFSTALDVTLQVENDTDFAHEVLDVLNEYRASKGLSAFQWHNESEELAVSHSYYMVQENRASHDNFYERAEILKDHGADQVSENVAYGYQDAASVLQGWLDSPSHKSAIEGDYTHSGIGIVHTDNGIPYYTQLFIK